MRCASLPACLTREALYAQKVLVDHKSLLTSAFRRLQLLARCTTGAPRVVQHCSRCSSKASSRLRIALIRKGGYTEARKESRGQADPGFSLTKKKLSLLILNQITLTRDKCPFA